jgi:hypothetical protein
MTILEWIRLRKDCFHADVAIGHILQVGMARAAPRRGGATFDTIHAVGTQIPPAGTRAGPPLRGSPTWVDKMHPE